MVDEEIVMDTIQKMKDSRLEDSIIISTLQDIGLSEEEAKNYISRVSGGIARPAPAPPPGAEPATPAAAPAAAPAMQPAPAVAPAISQAPAAAPAMQPAPAVMPAQAQPPLDVEETLAEAFEGQPAPQPVQPAPQPVQPAGLGTAPRRLEKAPGVAVQALTPAQFPQAQPEAAAEQAAQRLNISLAEKSEEDAMRHAATQAMVSQQSQAIGSMQKTIKKIERQKQIKIPPNASPAVKSLMVEVDAMRKDIEETKAMASATRTLMEKILEVNRKILGRLP